MDKAIENYSLFRDTCPKCNSRKIREEMQEPLPDGDVIFFYCCLDCGLPGWGLGSRRLWRSQHHHRFAVDVQLGGEWSGVGLDCGRTVGD